MTAARYRPGRARRARGARRVAIASLVAVAMVAAGITGMVWLGRGSAPPGEAAPGSRASHRDSVAPASAPASTAPVPARALTPAVDLAGLRWVSFYGIQLPVSPVAGPRHLRGGLAWGFTDTPLGALMAAVNIGVRANAQWGPGIFGPAIRRQVTGAGAAALLATCQATYQQERQDAGVPAGRPLGRAYVTEEAYRWVTYTPAAATVDVVSAGSGAQGATVRAVTQIEVAWSGRDWQVIAPLGGDWGNSAAPLTSLHGCTVFRLPPA